MAIRKCRCPVCDPEAPRHAAVPSRRAPARATQSTSRQCRSGAKSSLRTLHARSCLSGLKIIAGDDVHWSFCRVRLHGFPIDTSIADWASRAALHPDGPGTVSPAWPPNTTSTFAAPMRQTQIFPASTSRPFRLRPRRFPHPELPPAHVNVFADTAHLLGSLREIYGRESIFRLLLPIESRGHRLRESSIGAGPVFRHAARSSVPPSSEP